MQWLVATICLYAGVAFARTEEDQHSTTNSNPMLPLLNECFHRTASECPINGPNICRCKRIAVDDPKNHGLLCCDVTNETLEEAFSCGGFNNNVTHLHIRNATIDTIFADDKRWRSLKSLAITDGNINYLKEQFMMMTPLECLNLSNNALKEIANNSLNRLSQLTALDLSSNKLLNLPNLNSINDREFWLDIAETNMLWCHNIYEYINKTSEKQIKFNRESETICTTNKSWHWFNSTAQLSLAQLRYLNLVQHECPRGKSWECRCEIARLYLVPGKPPQWSAQVDCSGNQLTELPAKLPRNTIILNVSNNNITVLDALATNSCYEHIIEFNADYNSISSINKLEGSKFLQKFVGLSLRYNKIKSIPTYILSPYSLAKNYDMKNRVVYLAGNEIHCDCNTAKFLRVWLQTMIVDYNEVWCENKKEKVVDLEPAKMCVYAGDWKDYIYYIIATEIILLIGLVAKVSYDYWIFKTAGYLPWPANKMPKLPCDWLCET